MALLTTHEAHEAERLAQLLDTVNQQRRTLQQAMETAVHERIAQQYHGRPRRPSCSVIPPGTSGWSALSQRRWWKPIIVPLFSYTSMATRRVVQAGAFHPLTSTWPLALCPMAPAVGGHKHAAGLTMDTAHLPLLQENLMRFAADTLSHLKTYNRGCLWMRCPLADITPALVAELERCEPHGAGNPTPLFCAQAVQLASPVRRLGQQGQHARFRVTQDGATLNVVAFHQAEQVLALPARAVVDLAFTPIINTWRDQSQLEPPPAIRPHAPLHHGESH